jgi:hypothetical protein
MRDLLHDDREAVLGRLMKWRIETIRDRFEELYGGNRDLLKILSESSVAAPAILITLAGAVLSDMLATAVMRWERSLLPIRLEGVEAVITEAHRYDIPINTAFAAKSFSTLVLEKTKLLAANPDAGLIDSLITFIEFCARSGIELDLHEAQNEIYAVLTSKIIPYITAEGDSTDTPAEVPPEAATAFLKLATRLNFNVDELTERLADAGAGR